MKCRCGRAVVARFPYIAEPLCKLCFLNLIERRARRELKRVVEKDIVLLVDDETKEAAVLRCLLPRIIHRPAKLIIREKTTGSYTKIAATDTLDDIVLDCLSRFLAGKGTVCRTGRTDRKKIYPLREVMEEEAELFAKLKSLKYAKKRQRNKYEGQLKPDLEQLEKRFPGSKFSLLRSFDKITRCYQKQKERCTYSR